MLGLWSPVIIAFVLFAIMGAGTVDVAGYTLVQRAVPDEVLARVFLQFFLLSALGIGGLLAPILTDIFGLENALIISGLFLPVLVAPFGRTVAKIDAEAAAPERRSCGCSRACRSSHRCRAPLSSTSQGRLVPLRVEPETVILREGDPGDRFYVIVEGEVEVRAEGKTVATQGPGYFGEIALLKDVPRTATVKARRRSSSTRSSGRTSWRR